MRPWIKAALTPRMVGIFVLLMVAAGVCIRLGMWQVDRAQEGQRIAQESAQSLIEHSAPVPIADLLAPQESMSQKSVSRRVVVEGVFDDDAPRFWVPGRQQNGQEGYALVLAFEEESTGAILPVIAGFSPVADPGLLEPVAGVPGVTGADPIEIIGFLVPTEGAHTGALQEGELPSLSTAQLANVWGTPMYNGFVALTDDQPDIAVVQQVLAAGSGLEPMALPQVDADGVGLNVRNVLYAAEWFIFGGFALFLWVRVLRDEVAHQAAQAEESVAHHSNAS